jgi:hypothetical protein
MARRGLYKIELAALEEFSRGSPDGGQAMSEVGDLPSVHPPMDPFQNRNALLGQAVAGRSTVSFDARDADGG